MSEREGPLALQLPEGDFHPRLGVIYRMTLVSEDGPTRDSLFVVKPDDKSYPADTRVPSYEPSPAAYTLLSSVTDGETRVGFDDCSAPFEVAEEGQIEGVGKYSIAEVTDDDFFELLSRLREVNDGKYHDFFNVIFTVWGERVIDDHYPTWVYEVMRRVNQEQVIPRISDAQVLEEPVLVEARRENALSHLNANLVALGLQSSINALFTFEPKAGLIPTYYTTQSYFNLQSMLRKISGEVCQDILDIQTGRMGILCLEWDGPSGPDTSWVFVLSVSDRHLFCLDLMPDDSCKGNIHSALKLFPYTDRKLRVVAVA